MSNNATFNQMDALIASLENEYDPNAVRQRMNATTLKSVLDRAMAAKDDDGMGQVVFLHINKDGELID